MRKSYIAVLAFVAALFTAVPATAQNYSATADSEIYDFTGFNDVNLLNLFYNVWQQGRKYPTAQEFEAAGIQAQDLAFIRSHVRRAEIMSRADRLVTSTYETRNLFMNIPMDVGKSADVGYPEGKFLADVYSMWQYTNLFGSWNHGIFSVPGAWVDAAHRNGTDIMSGIKFFESWTAGGDAEYSAFITEKDSNGNFKWVQPLINCLMFFGSDGINYNWEDNSYSNSDIVAFHKALWAYAQEVGFDNYHSAIYTASQMLSSANVDALYGTSSTGKTHDTMLNYSSGAFSYYMAQSVNQAESAMGTADGLYAGVWIATMAGRGWTRIDGGSAHRCGLCLWGEHGQSRFMSYNTGDGMFDTQGNYQRLLERGFSGGYRNPMNRPAVTDNISWERTADSEGLGTFCGLAQWIPERSAIQGNLPFGTHFTLGNGDRYFYKGKKSHAGDWYNMSSQDLVPTYRWLIYNANTTTVSTAVDVNYTHLDAYTGGSCIELTGASTSTGTDIVLYKTALTVSGSNPYAKVAVKTLKDVKATDLYLIIKTRGNSAWQEYAVGDVAGNTWEEKQFNLSNLSTGSVIERIGLRVKGNNNDYQLYVGKLEINDDAKVTPANVKDLYTEVKRETKTSMTIKMYWDVEATAGTRADWDLVYNDEANISHFEIFLKMGEEGRVSQVGTTSQWATLIPNIDFESVNDQPFVGVRSVSTDLKTCSPVVWVEVPRAAQSALPEKEEEFGNYGVSQLDPDSEGTDRAKVLRFLTKVSTTGAVQNLDYTNSFVPTSKTVSDGVYAVPDGSQYVDATDHVLKVRQGQSVTIYLKAFDSSNGPLYADDGNPDGLRWCFAGCWMDLNGSGDFDKPLPVQRTQSEIDNGTTSTDPEGERLFFAGTVRAGNPEIETSGSYYTFTVPSNATPGQSRMRIVFSDAWFAGMFQPVGFTAKGFTIDFGVEIQGSNPGRVVVDTRDAGIADEPEGVSSSTNINDVEAGEISEAVAENGAINFNNVEKAWIYSADGRLVEFVKGNPSQVSTAQYAAGVYLIKMQYKNVIRSAKVVIK